MRRFLLSISISLLVASATSLLAQAILPKARVAILVEDTSVVTAADVLTVTFSTNNSLELLEREQIAKVYREQALAAGNRDYLKLGQLLGADGLLILEPMKEGENRFLALRLVAVKPAVQLTAARFNWPIEDLRQWSAGVTRHIASELPKLTVLVEDAVPISVVNIRSGISSAAARELERELTTLAIERLSAERRLFILERRRMDALNLEKELSGVDDSSFWNGCYLFEGTLDRDSYSALTLTLNARLMPPNGGAPAEIAVSGSRTNLVPLMNQLAEKVLAALNVQPAAKRWNPSDEADVFRSEAEWAYRWGLLAQAQTASESAWALGVHTRELAALRIRAYADQVWPPAEEWRGNLIIPAVPEAAQLPPLIRVLELYQHNAPMFFTNGMCLDEEWFKLGLRVLRESAAVLDGFYHAAELRAGNEESLLEVRSLTRRMVEFVDTRTPPYWIAKTLNLTNELGQLYSRTNFIQKPEMYDTVKWYQGGVFFDEPEEGIPMFRAMLANGYVPPDMPRVVGWKWESRKKVPDTMRRFIEASCLSTNISERLSGLLLSLMGTEFYPKKIFHDREQALLNELWANRQWLLGDERHAAQLRAAEKVIRSKYAETDVYRPFEHEPFASFLHELRKEYLRNPVGSKSPVTSSLFPSTLSRIPPQQALELLSLLEPPAGGKNSFRDIKALLRESVGLTNDARNLMPAPSMPRERTFPADYVRWDVANGSAASQEKIFVKRLITRGDKLWAHVVFLPPKGTLINDHFQNCFLRIDPTTGSTERFGVTGSLGLMDGGFDVAGDALYVSAGEQLHRCNLRNKKWQTIPVPTGSGAQLLVLQDRLYSATAEGLLEIDPETRATQILASSRRRPALHSFDSLWKSGTRIFARSDGKIGILLADRSGSFDPVSHTWAESTNLPKGSLDYLIVQYPSGDGVQMLLTGIVGKRHLMGFRNDHTMHPLLYHDAGRMRGMPDPLLDAKVGSPQWDWPQSFDLEGASILQEGGRLVTLNPRRIWTGFGGILEPIIFNDKRTATLLQFEPEFRQPLGVPIAFEKHAADLDPFAADSYYFPGLWDRVRRGISDVPFWLNTPSAYVFSTPVAGGHWLLPKTALDQRLAAAREELRKSSTILKSAQQNRTESQIGNAAEGGKQ